MSKPTPGPWEIYRDSGLNIFISQPSSVANRIPGYYAEVRRFTPDDRQVEANARLIAAAPDLLEALQEVMSWIDNWDPDFTFDNEWAGTEIKARAAIKKATGEE